MIVKKGVEGKRSVAVTVLVISALSSCIMLGAVGIYRLSSEGKQSARNTAEESGINSTESSEESVETVNAL